MDTTPLEYMMFLNRLLHFGLLGTTVMILSGAGVDAPLPVMPSSTAIKEQLRRVHDRLHSWSVEYQVAGRGLPYYNHRLVAAHKDRDSCFLAAARGDLSFRWDADHIGDDWKMDTLQDRLLITSTHAISCTPMSRRFTKFAWPKNGPLPDKLRDELVFQVFGWWPFDKRRAPELFNVGPCVLPAISASTQYVVRPQFEWCQGSLCCVLEHPAGDRLWLDLRRTCVIMAREFFDKRTGAVAQRFLYSGHYELQSGIWIPRHIHNILFDSNARTPELRRRCVAEAKIEVINVRLNEDVDATLFQENQWPPGELEVFGDGSYKQVVVGGFDYMDDIAGLLKHSRGFQAVADYSSRGRSRRLSIIVMTCLLTAVVYWIQRRRRTGVSGGTPRPTHRGLSDI